jgi:hypothetical protein
VRLATGELLLLAQDEAEMLRNGDGVSVALNENVGDAEGE